MRYKGERRGLENQVLDGAVTASPAFQRRNLPVPVFRALLPDAFLAPSLFFSRTFNLAFYDC